MKQIIKSIVALTLLSGSAAHAAGYGVIDIERAVEQSTYIKQQNAVIQKQIQPQTNQISALSKELEALQQRAQQTGAKLSDAEKQKFAAQYEAKINEMNSLQQKVQGVVENNIQSIKRTMDARIKQAAEQLRKENSLDVVLNKNSALAYDPKFDLTDKLIQKVNSVK
ncbi:OmpH family outer membrane protein [Acinetobacter tianfuensis]|uniref:OmpH family outer membrane protein n=1 Tax=Acinetobacter tianfuensis TaxID=2419603 RepID=A0A3A8EHP7_9GAMM|nr:OmpH family outer membrane protein [Acinetobacter tianfuensis]RKG34105.1 OmpH family outer membrane protein [Acinetobacter tianfuensis]